MNVDYLVKIPPAVVFDYLTDMQKFVTVHPVIYKIEHIRDNKYLIFEKLKFGFIPYSFTYTATVHGNIPQQKVTMQATVMKVVHIEMNFTIKKENGQVSVNETTHFKTFLPVKSMMQKIFTTQHKQLFINLDKLLS
jgi:carbon monoxide dehydrogenase subunit G